MGHHNKARPIELGRLYRPSELAARIKSAWPETTFALGAHRGMSALQMDGVRGRTVTIHFDRRSEYGMWRAWDTTESCVGAVLRRHEHRHLWDQIMALIAWLRGDHDRVPIVDD